MADCNSGLDPGPSRWPDRGDIKMQLVASIGLIVIGLFLVNVDDSPSDMRVYGWIVLALGVFGLLLRFLISRIGRDQDR
jgi:hypothetical protein